MAESAYRLYRCLVSTQRGPRVFHKGTLYSFTSDPGIRFESVAALGDPRLPAPPAMLDHDGTWYPGVFGWADFSFPSTSSKLGILDKPDFDYDDIALLFPQNDTDEVIFQTRISPHELMIGTDVYWFPHIHRLQAAAGVPVYEYCFRICTPGAAVPDFSDWIATTGALEFAYSSGKIHQIMHFPAFNAYDAGHVSPACSVDIQVRRNDNVLTGDDLFKAFDFHVPLDAPLGSGQQFLK